MKFREKEKILRQIEEKHMRKNWMKMITKY